MPENSRAVAAKLAIHDLPSTLRQVKGWDECIAALKSGKEATFDSVWGSSCALLASALSTHGFRSILLVLPTDREIEPTIDDLNTFGIDDVGRFPACPNLGIAELATDEQFGQRLRLLREIIDEQAPQIILSSISGLLQAAALPDDFASHIKKFRVGGTLHLDEVRDWLVENGFHATSAVELPGEFSSRGGILDIFPPDVLKPVRIELFDEEIDSIRFFDVGTQRSIQKCNEVEIGWLPTDVSGHGSLIDYLPDKSLVLQVEPNEIVETANQYLERASHSTELLSLDELQSKWSRFALASANRLAVGMIDPQCMLPVETLGQFSGDLSEVKFELERLAVDQQVYLVANSDAEIERVKEILNSTQAYLTGRLQTSVGYIRDGFRLRHVESIVLGCDQLFQRSDLRRTWRRRSSRKVENFSELKKGELVVHMSHGIGRYRGLKLIEHDGHQSEHLEIEFAGGTRVYVSINKIGLVQKYVGGVKTQPKLAKIGGKSWIKQKQAAEDAVHDLAAEMLEVQAARASKPGIQHGPDSQWQYEFEQSFPYRETEDQLTAIEAIKTDMESPKPMDRLLCGDVGFGKTEVAMRAAFKAVESGHQAAILVPTTVLAEQHFHTFKERMAEYPIKIARLSRFASTKEQRETVAALAEGTVDIAIGTHRIVSKDVRFKNLGVVIIDEEQRFGVGVKERLKGLRLEVDVLTMSATPIPRTLHMSMVGVRDISNLTVAPADRIPVQTKISRFDAELVKEAMTRELNRQGQLFFVHNRVNDIHIVKQRLEHFVPDAKIGVGHGQMPESELEEVMAKFIAGDYDILLATTIIENGLDIPNANTIIINEADRFGLSELHQLRGRVGRYKHRAFCYLLLDSKKHLSPVAAKRLQAIEHYSEMGAGFAIAMRDLEIRGAGNLLGTQQSGHIAAVGYEMYCQLLEAAVRQLKQMPAKLSINIDIDLPVEAFIPDEYIPVRRQKVDIYRRLYQLESFDELAKLRGELRDRFGPIPKPTKRLIKLGKIKLEAAIWQVSSIFIEEKKYLGFRFADTARIKQLVSQSKMPLRIADDSTVFVTLNLETLTPDRLLDLVQSILQAT